MPRPAILFIACIAPITAPFLAPCSRPAQPTPDDRAAIEKLTAHLRSTEDLEDHHSSGKWLVFSSGAAARGELQYSHAPSLQIGGVLERSAQDRILGAVQGWRDKSRFDRVKVYFYGAPKDPADPSSALLNLIHSEEVFLRWP